MTIIFFIFAQILHYPSLSGTYMYMILFFPGLPPKDQLKQKMFQ